MEVKVDFDLCEANAVCCGLAPDIFELDDDENLIVKVATIPRGPPRAGTARGEPLPEERAVDRGLG